MDSDSVRASELGTYQYCRRAWWYSRQGHEGVNERAMKAGTGWHNDQARRAWSAGCLRNLGFFTLSVAFFLFAIYLSGLVIG
jgi:hypothetical protein